MRVIIEAESQEEFDSKREELIKALSGKKLEVSVRTKVDQHKIEMDDLAMREAYNMWLNDFNSMIKNIKKDIKEYLETSDEF